MKAKRKKSFVELLAIAAVAQEDLAETYRTMSWDVAADRAEEDARDFRQRIAVVKSSSTGAE